MVNLQRMEAQLVLHEGVILHPYPDSDEPPNWTLGVGYNITARGLDFFTRTIGRKIAWAPPPPTWTRKTGYSKVDLITKAEALLVLDADIARVERAIRAKFPDYDNLNEVRQRVCVDMTFNIGYGAFSWHNTIAAAQARDWSKVARELYKSKWCTQVGDGEGGQFDRADRLATMALTGLDYTK